MSEPCEYDSATLISWTEPSSGLVDVIWLQNGSERRAVLSVEYDVDGPSFDLSSGDKLPDDDGEFLWSLKHDMDAHRGSEFIPISPRHLRTHAAHRSDR